MVTMITPVTFLAPEIQVETFDVFARLKRPVSERGLALHNGDIRNLVTPTLQSPNRGAFTYKNQAVPYGTTPWGGDVPGTSCQATIALSLRGLSDFQLGR